MTYPPAPAPVGRQRPTTVTVASGLLIFLVALLLINTALGFVANTAAVKAATDELNKSAGATSNPLQSSSQIIGVVAALIFAAGFLALAFFNLQGKNASRIVTWVFGGIGALCCSCGAFFNGASSMLVSSMPETSKQAYQNLLDAYPSWYSVTNVVIPVLSVLSLLAVIILLALPASNAYFRKQEPEWIPPAQF